MSLKLIRDKQGSVKVLDTEKGQIVGEIVTMEEDIKKDNEK